MRGPRTRHVDERHDCRDIVPACVPSTVWGTASMRNRQVELGAVLAPQCRNATPPPVTASGRARPAGRRHHHHHHQQRRAAVVAATASMLRAKARLWSGLPHLPTLAPGAQHHSRQPRQASHAEFTRVLTAIDTWQARASPASPGSANWPQSASSSPSSRSTRPPCDQPGDHRQGSPPRGEGAQTSSTRSSTKRFSTKPQSRLPGTTPSSRPSCRPASASASWQTSKCRISVTARRYLIASSIRFIPPSARPRGWRFSSVGFDLLAVDAFNRVEGGVVEQVGTLPRLGMPP